MSEGEELGPIEPCEPPETPIRRNGDLAFAQLATRMMDKYHGCLVGEAAKAWHVTVEELQAVLNLREMPSDLLRAGVVLDDGKEAIALQAAMEARGHGTRSEP